MTLRTSQNEHRKQMEEKIARGEDPYREEFEEEMRKLEAELTPLPSWATYGVDEPNSTPSSSSTAAARVSGPPMPSRPGFLRIRPKTRESPVPTTAVSASGSTTRSTRSRGVRTSRSNTHSQNGISPEKPLATRVSGEKDKPINGSSRSSDSSDLLDTINVEDKPVANGQAEAYGTVDKGNRGEEGTEDGYDDVDSPSSHNSAPYVPKPTKKPRPSTKITLTFGRKRKANEAGLADGDKKGKMKSTPQIPMEGNQLKPPSMSTSPEASSRISILEDITTEAETNELLNRLREYENGVEDSGMSTKSKRKRASNTRTQSPDPKDWGDLPDDCAPSFDLDELFDQTPDKNGLFTLHWDKSKNRMTAEEPERFVHPLPIIEEPRVGEAIIEENIQQDDKREREETDPLTEPEDEEPEVELPKTVANLPVVPPITGVPMSRDGSRNGGKRAPRKKRKWLKKGEVDPDDPIAVARQKERHMMIDQALTNLDRQYDHADRGVHEQLFDMFEELETRREWQLERLEERYKATLAELAWVANHEAEAHMETWEANVLAIKRDMTTSNEHKQWVIEDQKASWKRKPTDFKHTRVGAGGGGWMVYDEYLLSKKTLPVVPTFLDGTVRQRVKVKVKPVMLDPTTILDDLKIYDVRQPKPKNKSHSHSTQNVKPVLQQQGMLSPTSRTPNIKPVLSQQHGTLSPTSRTQVWLGLKKAEPIPPIVLPKPRESLMTDPDMARYLIPKTATKPHPQPTTASAAPNQSTPAIHRPTTATGSIPHAPQPKTATAAPPPTTNGNGNGNGTGTGAQKGMVAPMGSRWASGQNDGNNRMAPPTTNTTRTNGHPDPPRQAGTANTPLPSKSTTAITPGSSLSNANPQAAASTATAQTSSSVTANAGRYGGVRPAW